MRLPFKYSVRWSRRCHCEERSDAAIQHSTLRAPAPRLLSFTAVRCLLLFAATLLLSSLGTSSVLAQAVRWEPSDADPAELILIFENCSPNGAPRLPAIDGVQADLTGQGSRTEFNNFRRTDYVQLNYRLRTRSNSPVTIPAFDVKTDKGDIRVPAFKTAGAARNPSLDNAASSQLVPSDTTLWAGEVFPLNYILDVNRRNFSQLETNPDWSASPLVAEDWSKPEPGERVINGEAKLNIVYRTRAYAKTSGSLTLNPVTQIVRLQTGSIGFGLFQQPRLERLSVESTRPTLTVRPLPTPAPAGFGGAVGQFKLVSKVVPEKAGVGEPVTWTLELSGTGNWPDVAGLPQRDVSNDFQVVQPKAKRTPSDGKLFDVTLAEDVVLVPSKPGTYNLGPVNFAYFDPKTGTYKTISAPRTTVTITAPAAPQFNVTPAPGAQSTDPVSQAHPAATATSPAQSANAKAQVSTPAAPAGIPRDPLPGSGTASAPLTHRTLFTFLAAPFTLLLAFWVWLAIRRAQQTDPVRPRREARARLTATLAKLRSPSSLQLSPSDVNAQQQPLLLRWQHDTAILWQLTHAAPPASALLTAADATPSSRSAPSPDASVWSTLWQESDRALYGPSAALPSDWIARAEAALVAKRVPGFNPLRLFLPRNLLPFAALLLLALVLPSPISAAEPTADYTSGKFPAAEKSWREALAKNPTDWIAHHNLSLALAQQDKAGEAAAHAAAAFVQNPAHPAVRWHLAHISEKAGYAPPPLAPFLRPTAQQTLAALASPATWQRLLIASACLAALSLAGLLARTFGNRSHLLAIASFTLLPLSILLAVSASIGWQTYANTADTTAVVAWRAGTLRSIPTEADTTQKTTALPAGSVALVTKTFLGWHQLTFDNGQTGWVRKDELVPLWK